MRWKRYRLHRGRGTRGIGAQRELGDNSLYARDGVFRSVDSVVHPLQFRILLPTVGSGGAGLRLPSGPVSGLRHRMAVGARGEGGRGADQPWRWL